jgi:hypothetical protein
VVAWFLCLKAFLQRTIPYAIDCPIRMPDVVPNACPDMLTGLSGPGYLRRRIDLFKPCHSVRFSSNSLRKTL